MVRIKWHLHTKNVENRVDLYHNSYRDEERHMESKQIFKIIVTIKWHLHPKQVEKE